MVSRRLLRIKVFQLLYAFFTNEDGDTQKYKKELTHSVNKTHELYYKFFLLLIDVRELAINKLETAKTKKLPSIDDLNPNTKLIENKILIKIDEDEGIKRYLNASKTSWVNDQGLVKKIYKRVLETDYYKKYITNENDVKSDKKLLYSILEETVLECSDIEEYLENSSIYWNDELEFVIDMVIKTIKSIDIKSDKIELLPLYKNTSDKDFTNTLFMKTIVNNEENKALIAKYIKNWDSERLAFNDVLFMEMAIVELKYFNEIPVRVTLNEYIELSKFYSTDQSSAFINGILDKIIKDLKKTGEIKKVGMGLKGEI
jgi:N utilization substance protein B